MAKPCGIICTKIILVLYNCPFLLVGAFLLVCGLWLHFDKEVITYFKIMETALSGPLLQTVAYILIGCGGFLLLIGFLGCCGACCESMCLLCLYILLLLIIIITQIGGAITLAVLKAKFLEFMGKSMQDQIKYNYNRTFNTTDALTIAWDMMQVQLQCCGSQGPQDYRESYWFNQTHGQFNYFRAPIADRRGNFVPATCCVLTNQDPRYPQVKEENQCQIDAILYPDDIVVSEAVKTKGCQEALVEWIGKHKTVLIVVSVVMAILEISGLILACFLMSSIRKEQSKYPWYVDDDEDE